jgi:hypothetical protein
MSDSAELVSVYRSMDAGAQQDCEAIVEILTARGLSPSIFDDNARGVPAGAFEVRVPAGEAQKAEELIAENPLPGDVETVDGSSGLDMETIFQAVGTTGEMQALGIQNVLEANGIATVFVGDSVLPYLSFEVRVARDQLARAREVIRDAQAAGPEAADEASLETESGQPGS